MAHESPFVLGLAAALRALRWPDVTVLEDPGAVDNRPFNGPFRLLLIADEQGRMPRYRPLIARARQVVAVGGLAAADEIARAIEQGATVALDIDQPFHSLLSALVAALRDARSPSRHERSRMVSALRNRGRESALFASLTERECEILGTIVRGLTASEIAPVGDISIATVRSHLQRILAKLGVNSQITAVAMTHRSCRDPRILPHVRSLHQF